MIVWLICHFRISWKKNGIGFKADCGRGIPCIAQKSGRHIDRVCRFGKYANDQKLLDEEVMQYERRILEARKNSGMLTEKEFRQLQDELLMQFPLW